jgi:carbon-monoxide dehydrogenase medium subunit
MIPGAFDYLRPASVEEALGALGEDAKPLAGGHSLIPLLKLRLARPAVLVDIGRLDLRGLAGGDGAVRVGALTTHAELERAPELRGPLRALAQAAGSVGDRQVRNLGTVGGSVAHGDPSSDAAAALLALGARFRVRSARGEREVPADEFFLGAFTTALEPDELLVELVLPDPGAGAMSAYVAIEDPASGYPLAGAAALARADGSVAVGVTGVASRPFRIEGEEALAGALRDVEVLDDPRCDREYRRHLAGVVVHRAVARARGEEER